MELTVAYFLGIFSILLILTLLYRKSMRAAYLPPGPPTLPFIGNLNLDQQNLVKSFRRFRIEYGDVFSLILGAKTVVVINGLDALKYFFVKNAETTSERPDIFAFSTVLQKSGIIGSSGRLWKEQRTFTMSALKELGVGKRNIESKVIEEVEIILQYAAKTKGQCFDIYDSLNISIANITCSIIFGKRFNHDDEKCLGLLKCLNENISNQDVIGMATFLPFVKYIPWDPFRIRKLLKDTETIQNYLRGLIEEHKTTFDENNICDFLYAYLRKMYKSKTNTDNSGFTENQLLMVIGDLFFAGTETTTTALYWFILFTVRNPEIQEKMRAEMKKEIVQDRLPNMSDRKKLTYCDAVLHETLRCGNITPLGVPHGLTRDICYKGYRIPNDVVLFPSLDSVLYDPDVFTNPEEFDPSRFLDGDCNLVEQDKIIPFSIGRRVCLGKTLAKMELFLFATSLVQRFRLLPEKDDTIPGIKSVLGITNAPTSFQFRAVEII